MQHTAANSLNIQKKKKKAEEEEEEGREVILLPCLALPLLRFYSNPRNVWHNQAAEASALHHEEEISM